MKPDKRQVIWWPLVGPQKKHKIYVYMHKKIITENEYMKITALTFPTEEKHLYVKHEAYHIA